MVYVFNKLIFLIQGNIVDFHIRRTIVEKGPPLNLIPSENNLQLNSEYSSEK